VGRNKFTVHFLSSVLQCSLPDNNVFFRRNLSVQSNYVIIHMCGMTHAKQVDMPKIGQLTDCVGSH